MTTSHKYRLRHVCFFDPEKRPDGEVRELVEDAIEEALERLGLRFERPLGGLDVGIEDTDVPEPEEPSLSPEDRNPGMAAE